MWSTLKRKAGVRLATLGADGNPLKFVYFIAVRVGEPEDYQEHWTSRGMDALATLKRVLNTKNAHDGTETTEKGIVRKTVTEVEQEIIAKSPKITPKKLLERIAADERVIESIKNHDAAAQQFVIGDTRGADGSVTKTRAAKAAIEMLQKDPDAFKAFCEKQGIEL